MSGTPKITVRSPRRQYDRPIGLLYRGAYFVCRGLQISESGMLVGVDLALEKGDLVVLAVILPSGHSVVTRGEILYARKLDSGEPAYGLRFVGIAVEDRRIVRNYVSAKTREEAEREVYDS